MMMVVWSARLAAVLTCLTLAPDLFAQSGLTASGLADITIEELMNIRITTASKREQNLRDTASAITVLSNDDLRRAGATSLPEALRLVPGMDVGAVNAREWAVSARGFNRIFANKVLVLVDGRVVYSPVFAGVIWVLQQVMLEDVDRIEVIRGPGATVWGANAVNGVINVVTRSARDSQGGFLSAGGGDVLQGTASGRYGGSIDDNTFYRVFGSYQSRNGYSLIGGAPANDGWAGRQGGFRIDRYSSDGRSQLTWQADTSGINAEAEATDGYNANTVGRWSRKSSARSSVEVQAFYDRTYYNEAARSRNSGDTFDVAAQQTVGIGERSDIVWGLGYRFVSERLGQTNPGVQVRGPKFNLGVFSAFVQDDFRLVPDVVTLTAGVKMEHNGLTGVEMQPSARAVFKPSARQTFWTAVSRAVRTPNAIQHKDLLGIRAGASVTGPGGGLIYRRLSAAAIRGPKGYGPTSSVGASSRRRESVWTWPRSPTNTGISSVSPVWSGSYLAPRLALPRFPSGTFSMPRQPASKPHSRWLRRGP